MSAVRWFVGVCAGALLAGSANAQPDRGVVKDSDELAEGTLQVRIIGQRHLMVRCDLSSRHGKRFPANLLVELDEPGDFELVAPASLALELEPGDTVTAHFPGFALRDLPGKSVGDDRLELYRQIARYHSIEMGDVACMGRIGYAVLKPYRIGLDLSKSEMKLTPAAGAQPAAEDPEAITVPLSIETGIPWLAVQVTGKTNEKKNGMFALGTSTYDTLIAKDLARELGRPAGDVGTVTVGRQDFSPFVAFRPAVLDVSHTSGALGVTGMNLLLCHRMEIDPVAATVRVRQTAPAKYPEEDFAFFNAMVTEKADPVEEYVKQYPKVRLAGEAADLLLLRRVDTALEKPDDLKRAVQWVNDVTAEDLRSTKALDVMDVLQKVNLPDFEIHAGELGLEKGRIDRDSTAVHKIHGRLGELKIDKDDLDAALSHLLAAAFGLPLDGPVNYNLGVLWEKKGKLDRAFSRYMQAAVTKEAASRAWKGLSRIQEAQGKGSHVSVATLEHHIAAKVPSYGSAARFQATPENSSNRVVLFELFTNPLVRPHIAAELAFDAATAYFPRENVAVLQHHLAGACVSPVALDQGAFLQGAPTMGVLDGTVKFGLAGRIIHKEIRFDQLKEKVYPRLKQAADYKLELTAEVADGAVKGEVKVTGPAAGNLSVHVILAEKGLLFPGESFTDKQLIAVHHMVSRVSLLEGGKGAAFQPESQGETAEQSIPFNRTFASVGEELEAFLTKIEKENGAQFSLRHNKVDPAQASVVAYLRNDQTKEVLQAAHVHPKQPADATPPAAPEQK